MEETKPIFNDLQVDFMGSQQLTETSRWAKFFAIMCISMGGLLLLLVLLVWNKLSLTMEASTADPNQVIVTILIFLIVLLAILITLMFFLIRGMNRIRRSLQTKEQSVFNDGLADVKTYFTIYGVVVAVALIIKLIRFF